MCWAFVHNWVKTPHEHPTLKTTTLNLKFYIEKNFNVNINIQHQIPDHKPVCHKQNNQTFVIKFL